jgi:chorismate mutase / prephenate dehydrogenase
MNLEALRAALDEVDLELVRILAHRQALVARIGASKLESGRPLRDFAREKQVLDRARAIAAEQDIDPRLVEQVLELLIQSALERQEQARVIATGQGSGQRALILGGAGKMGRWFAEFLDAQGYAVEISDPSGTVPGFPSRPAWPQPGEGAPDHDLIVVAATLGASADLLAALAEAPPRGVVFDIGSIKSPLIPGLEALAQAGTPVVSIHPMFGPDTRLLSGRHVLLCPVGPAEQAAPAMDRVRSLFQSTTAELIEMGLAEHDRLVAYVLGLSHALNIAFFTALAESGEAAPRLAALSSTTFDAQLAVASRVAEESPFLYYEIQHANRYGDEALQALEQAVARVVRTVRAEDRDGFAALMLQGRTYLAGRARSPRDVSEETR